MSLNDEQAFPVIRFWDEAIDWKRTTVREAEYATKRDVSVLAFREGMRPAVFHVRRLRDEIAVRLADIPGDNERWRQAFIFALVKVEGGEDRDGRPIGESGVWAPRHIKEAGRSRKPVSAFLDEEERALFSLDTQIEIGAVAYQRSFFEPRSAHSYELPPTSVRAWGGLSSRRAELDKSAGGETGTEPPPPPKSTADGSVSGGDATAAETSGAG